MQAQIRNKRLRSFLGDKPAMIGAGIMLLFILAGTFAPLIAPTNPYDLQSVDIDKSLLPPFWMRGEPNGEVEKYSSEISQDSAEIKGNSVSFFLGTDDQGRDILSTILFGLRTSLLVAFSVVLIAGTMGIALGMLGGYYGGWVDAFVMRSADTVFSFSTTLLAVLLLGVFEDRGVGTIIFAICIADWVKYARTIRGSVLEIKSNPYIMAAKSSGAKDFRILFQHILPNALPPILVVMAVDLAVVIMLEATLSFLGVGVPLTEPSLGMMIAIGKQYIYADMWWMTIFPGVTLIMLVVSINLFADWLRDELNPKLTR